MVAQKRKREGYESDVVSFLRRGTVSILEAVAMKLPDVFAAEILPKLEVLDTLNLAQVSNCLLYTSPSPRDLSTSRMPSSA